MFGEAAIDFRAVSQLSGANHAADDPAFLAIFADDHQIYLSGNESVGRQLEHTILKARESQIYHLECVMPERPVIAFDLDLGAEPAGEDPGAPPAGFVCGTLIETPDGLVPVEQMEVGDLVLCGDDAARPVLWRSSQIQGDREANENPDRQPILIRRDALADGLPSRDLLVAPNQRVLIDDWRAELMFGEAGVLVSAAALVDNLRITRAENRPETAYHSLLLEGHQILRAEGLATDSLFPDASGMAGLAPEDRRALLAACPQLGDADGAGTTCHPVLSAAETLVLLGG